MPTVEEANSAVGDIIATPNTLPTLWGKTDKAALHGLSNKIRGYGQKITRDFSDVHVPFDDSRIATNFATQVGYLQECKFGLYFYLVC